jgi:hypothetical protein
MAWSLLLLVLAGAPDAGADIDAQLLGCVARSEMDCAQLALAAGANPNTSMLGNSALYMAAGGTDPRIIKLLVKAGADINGRTAIAGRTALHEAVTKGRLENVRMLLELGADKTITTHHGRTPFDFAVSPPLPLRPPSNGAEIAALLRGQPLAGDPRVEPELDPDHRWLDRDRETLRKIAEELYDRMVASLGIPADERQPFVTCFELGAIRKFPGGAADLNAARPGEVAAVSDGCARRWRDPIEASTTWTFSAEALYRAQCAQSAWKNVLRPGVELTELCACLAKSARTAFPVPSDLWKVERTVDPKQLTAAQRKAVQRLSAPCLKLMKTE